MGFKDFAGSTVVHSVGGWMALVGVLVIGLELKKFFLKNIFYFTIERLFL
jgi:Amt family ammonium transporter